MASQPILSFSEPVYRQPKPKVTFAVIAGDAAQAVDTAVNALPEATRQATLDDLAWRGMTEHLIATAETLLSPRIYAAFLRWGEAASHFSTRYDDEEGEARCDANSQGVRAVAVAPAANIHDIMLKVYLVGIEVGDFGAFSAITDGVWQNYLADEVARGAANEALWHSPLTSMIDKLASKAWRASPPTAIDPAIGAQITSAFSYARGVNSAARAVALCEPTAATPSDQVFVEHSHLLRTRNAVIAMLNAPDANPDGDEEQLTTLNQLDTQILSTPAQNKNGLFAQLLLAVQIAAEGHELDEDVASALVRRSIEVCGEGYVYSDDATQSEHCA